MTTSASRRFVLVCVWLFVVLIAATSTARQTQTSAERVADEAKESQASEAGSRNREGSKITDQLGEFQKSSDRFSFFQQDGKRAIQVLENLALERIARTLEDDPAPRLWSVSGVLTEFRGENFLLITRAVLKPRTMPATKKLEAENKNDEADPESTNPNKSARRSR